MPVPLNSAFRTDDAPISNHPNSSVLSYAVTWICDVTVTLSVPAALVKRNPVVASPSEFGVILGLGVLNAVPQPPVPLNQYPMLHWFSLLSPPSRLQLFQGAVPPTVVGVSNGRHVESPFTTSNESAETTGAIN